MPNDLTETGKPRESSLKSNKNITKALYPSNRIVQASVKKRRILGALRRGPKSSSVIADELRDLQDARGYPILSRRKIWFHLRDLKGLGLVESDEEGIYSLTLEGINVCDREKI